MENHPAGRHVEAEILSEAEVLGRNGALLAPEDREVSLVMVARGVAVDVIPAVIHPSSAQAARSRHQQHTVSGSPEKLVRPFSSIF